MNPARPLRSRQQVIDLIRSRLVVTAACRAAIDRGDATVLGGFAAPDALSPTYVLQVNGLYKQRWYVSLTPSHSRDMLKVSISNDPPNWSEWIGNRFYDGLWDIRHGDDPAYVGNLQENCNARPPEAPDS